jgi:hypothetical protein
MIEINLIRGPMSVPIAREASAKCPICGFKCEFGIGMYDGGYIYYIHRNLCRHFRYIDYDGFVWFDYD